MIFLMVLAFISIWIIVGNNEREPNWRLALVQTAILWGGFLILGTEILGFFSAINRLSLSLMWLLPVLIGIGWVWVWLKQGRVLRLPIVYHRDSWVGLVLDLFVILILVITAVVAIVSPPNSHEAMVSRMSRVAHWEQNQSLAHYPTGIETQNSHSPGAEIIALNLYVLGGSDRAVNMVAWLSFAGSVAAAASLAEVFGAKQNGQRMAAIFAATLPVAITQATSTLNDIPAAFWIVSAVLMLLYYTKKSPKPINLFLAGLAAALAVLTKPTAFIFLWPFALYLVVLLRKRLGMVRMLLWALVGFGLLGVLNGPHFIRNQETYGQFYRPVELSEQMNEVRNWRVTVSNIARNAALHADLPFPRAENWLRGNLEKMHERLGLEISDPRTTLGSGFRIPEVNTSETTSGNPVHAAMIVFSLTAVVGMVMLGKEDPDILVYIIALFFSVLMFCYFLKWQPQGGRLQLPFFILFAPIIAVLLDRLEKFEFETALAGLLLAYAMIWLFQTQERPVIPDAQRTYPVSVFSEDRESLYFATHPEDQPIYSAITDAIKNRGIVTVGLDLTNTSEEYPFWALLETQDDDLQIEWVNTETASSKYLRDDFSPDAIICENCAREDVLRYTENYERFNYSNFDLFMRDPK